MTPAEKAEHARSLIGEALTLARAAMVGWHDAGKHAAYRDAMAAADLLQEASMTLAVAVRNDSQ